MEYQTPRHELELIHLLNQPMIHLLLMAEIHQYKHKSCRQSANSPSWPRGLAKSRLNLRLNRGTSIPRSLKIRLNSSTLAFVWTNFYRVRDWTLGDSHEGQVYIQGG
jgi:hypothetical protein